MLRRYSPMKQSAGTKIPAGIREWVRARDGGMCIGPRIGMPGDCFGSIELDHVRASHGMGMKSESTPGNLVVLCGEHHRLRTENGREWRLVLLMYLAGCEIGDVLRDGVELYGEPA